MTDWSGIDRRALMAKMALLLGAAALPAEAFAAPRRGAARFLNPADYKLLSAVTDTILPVTDTPGALAAQVPGRIDGMLRDWASASTRIAVSEALRRIDAAAQVQKLKGFAQLASADRAAVLKPHDAAALKKVPPPPGATSATLFNRPDYVADPGYLKLKSLVIDLYYLSEIGSTHELAYEHVPGQYEPSRKLTPNSRPYLGLGPL